MVKGRDKPAGDDLAPRAEVGEDAAATRLDGAFAALGSAVRRQLLARLRRGPLAVAELVAGVAVSGPAVSKHLRALEEAGLVARTREGRQHRIRRVPGALAAARAWLTADAAGAAPLVAPPPARAAGWPATPAPVALPVSAACEHARALSAALAPALPVLAAALQPLAAGLAGPAAYRARLLRRRLADDPGLAGLLAGALAGAEALADALPTLDSRPASELESLTGDASRCSWLLTCHPALADLGLLAPAA